MIDSSRLKARDSLVHSPICPSTRQKPFRVVKQGVVKITVFEADVRVRTRRFESWAVTPRPRKEDNDPK